MTASQTLLFYDQSSQQPSAKLDRLPGLLRVASLSQFEASLENSNLVFLQAGGKLRQDAIKLLLGKKKSFALLDLENADLLNSERLRIAARKKHIQVCWLGSLRFRQAAARLQELLSSGCLGEIAHCQISKSPDSWTAYQTQDLLNWLLPKEISIDTNLQQISTDDFTLEIEASNGSAIIQLRKKQADSFRMKLKQKTEKFLACYNNAENTELSTLLLLHKLNKPWQIMAKPWDTDTRTHGHTDRHGQTRTDTSCQMSR